MKKEKFAEKLLQNGFILEEEWSDKEIGLTLYHNEDLKLPIFIIDRFEVDSGSEHDEAVINKILEFRETVKYEKRTIGVIFDMGNASKNDTMNDPYFFIKIPNELADLIPVKKEKVRINFIRDARSDKGEYEFLVNPFEDPIANLFEMLKIIKDVDGESEITIVNPIGLSSYTAYFRYFLGEYYDVVLKDWEPNWFISKK